MKKYRVVLKDGTEHLVDADGYLARDNYLTFYTGRDWTPAGDVKPVRNYSLYEVKFWEEVK